MHEYLDADERLAAAGATRSERPVSGGLDRLQAAHMLRGKGHREHGRIVESACWLARREALRSAGLFDERFAGYPAAALDASLRLRQAGFRLLTASDVLCWPGPDARGPEGAELERLRGKWCGGLTSLVLRLAAPR
jgi:GT2 family glycosyltransferase